MLTKDKLIPVDEVLTLMLAGNFTFTVTSLKTQRHFTFNVTLVDDSDFYEWEVKVLDSRQKYTKIGKLEWVKDKVEFTEETVYLEKLALVAFKYSFAVLQVNREGLIEFRPSGKCCRCGRQLTNDESIEKMIGPECEKEHKEFILSLIE